MTVAFRIHPDDNVATLLDDAQDRVTLRSEDVGDIMLREPIAMGHKMALVDIAAGRPVVKFGITIGIASAAIARGEWVHLHNCVSRYDERSGDFDGVTGAGTDMSYD